MQSLRINLLCILSLSQKSSTKIFQVIDNLKITEFRFVPPVRQKVTPVRVEDGKPSLVKLVAQYVNVIKNKSKILKCNIPKNCCTP